MLITCQRRCQHKLPLLTAGGKKYDSSSLRNSAFRSDQEHGVNMGPSVTERNAGPSPPVSPSSELRASLPTVLPRHGVTRSQQAQTFFSFLLNWKKRLKTDGITPFFPLLFWHLLLVNDIPHLLSCPASPPSLIRPREERCQQSHDLSLLWCLPASGQHYRWKGLDITVVVSLCPSGQKQN